MVDIGVTFADDTMPGIDLIYPDPGFIVDKKENLLGIVLTHAHEDHIGAIAHLWTNLKCKISDLAYLGEPKNKKFYFLTLKWTGDIDIDKPNPHTGEVEHDDHKWATIEEIKDIDNTEIPIYLLEKVLDMSKNAK